MEYLGRILSKSDVIKLKCSDGKDKYGRLTCDVFDNKGKSLALQMIKDGYAYAMPSQCFSQSDDVEVEESFKRILKNKKRLINYKKLLTFELIIIFNT